MNQFLCAKYFFILIPLSALLSLVQAVPGTDLPIFPGDPFLLFWNTPTESCDTIHNTPLDLSLFHSFSSPVATATNQTVTLFYHNRFGIHPYRKDDGVIIDKGLPQLIDMKKHIELATEHITYYMPTDQPGLAVLDFEQWRPQWIRNWGFMNWYRNKSMEEVKMKNPSLSIVEVKKQAEEEFSRAAEEYFIECLRLGKKLRPKSLWGYYLFPDCYNYEYTNASKKYTGKCPKIEYKRNDDLLWLWRESTALFPSIYLHLVLNNSRNGRLYIRHRVQEAMRVSMLPNSSHSIPVYPYIRPIYNDEKIVLYLTEFDLVSTIGEAAALGAAGVISWGTMDAGSKKESCSDGQKHLYSLMNPYLLNVTTAARLCSRALCQSRGRCLRKNLEDDVYLHLDPERYRIQRQHPDGPLTVNGSFSYDDVKWFDRHFDCMCFGIPDGCKSVLTPDDILMTSPDDIPKTAGTDGPRPLLLLVILLCLMLYEEQNM